METSLARDLMSDEEWAFHEPFIRAVRAPNGRKPANHRLVLDGIFWIARTGSPWRDLPERYGNWKTVSSRFYRWQQQGIWAEVFTRVQERADHAGHVDWEVQMIDSTIIRAHQSAAGAKKGRATKHSAVHRVDLARKST